MEAIDAIASDRMPGAALDRFVNESSWDRWEVRRGGRVAGPARTRSREPVTRRAVRKIHAALDRDPRSRRARKLVGEWDALLERESGDTNMSESKRQRWAGRRNWPAGMRAYVPSLYHMEWSVWERVAAFIDTVKLVKLPRQARDRYKLPQNG